MHGRHQGIQAPRPGFCCFSIITELTIRSELNIAPSPHADPLAFVCSHLPSLISFFFAVYLAAHEHEWRDALCARRNIVRPQVNRGGTRPLLTLRKGHVFGKPTRKEATYDNLHISRNAWDTNLVKVRAWLTFDRV